MTIEPNHLIQLLTMALPLAVCWSPKNNKAKSPSVCLQSIQLWFEYLTRNKIFGFIGVSSFYEVSSSVKSSRTFWDTCWPAKFFGVSHPQARDYQDSKLGWSPHIGTTRCRGTDHGDEPLADLKCHSEPQLRQLCPCDHGQLMGLTRVPVLDEEILHIETAGLTPCCAIYHQSLGHCSRRYENWKVELPWAITFLDKTISQFTSHIHSLVQSPSNGWWKNHPTVQILNIPALVVYAHTISSKIYSMSGGFI